MQAVLTEQTECTRDEQSQQKDVRELSDLQLAIIGGGSADVFCQ